MLKATEKKGLAIELAQGLANSYQQPVNVYREGDGCRAAHAAAARLAKGGRFAGLGYR